MSNESLLDERRDITPIIGGILLIGYILGYLYPDQWWGTHSLAFLPQVWMGISLGLAGGLIASPLFLKRGLSIKLNWPASNRNSWIASILISLGFTTLCLLIPIQDDNYGHSANYLEAINAPVNWPKGAIESLFSLDFSPGQGREAALGIVKLTGYAFELTLGQALYFLGILCYFLYNLVWMRFAKAYFNSASTKSLVILMGCTAPLIQVFLGHMETYSLVYLILTASLLLILLALKSPSRRKWGWLLALTIVGLRFHGFFLLLLPAVILIGLQVFKQDHPVTKRLLSPKGMVLFILIPLIAIGATIYFVVLQAHADPRSLVESNIGERLFLPMNSPDPPLDRYNLLSGYHLFDFVNTLFLWSTPALLILGTIFRAFRQRINWKEPALTTMMLTFFLVVLMLFMTNPPYSMPMDWDLYSFAGPVLLALTAALLAQLETERIASRIFLPALGLAIMTFPMLIVNASTPSQSQRLESVAKHNFRTYYLHSDEYLKYAQEITSPDTEAYLKRQARYLAELKPDARFQNDPIYQTLLLDHALAWERTASNPEKVRNRILEAELYGKLSPATIQTLMENHLQLDDFAQANFRAQQLIEIEYPSKEKALRKGIQTALAAPNYEQANERCVAYLKLNPLDKSIQKIATDLEKGEAFDQIQF